MNKSELIDRIATSSDISKAAASRALDATLDAITNSLKQADPVALVGFGTFTVRDRAARIGRNPQTGAPIQSWFTRAPQSHAMSARLTNVRPITKETQDAQPCAAEA